MTQEAAPPQQEQQHQQDQQQPEREHRVEESDKAPVAYERFEQRNRQYKAAEARARQAEQALQGLQSRLEELESRDQNDLERERKKRQQFEQSTRELEQRVMTIERQGWLREAAREAKFDDPEDACAFIDVTHVEDPEDAVVAVKDLAKRKPRLLRNETPPSEIGQVVRGGQQVRGQQMPPGPVDEEMTPEARQFLEQIRSAQEARGWQSTRLE